jgi:hypothetical protein
MSNVVTGFLQSVGISTELFLTIVVVAGVIIPIWSTYTYKHYNLESPQDTARADGSVPPNWLASFTMTWNQALPFLLAVYALYLKNRENSYYGAQYGMYLKLALVALYIVAWVMVFARPIGGTALNNPGNDRGDALAKYTMTPIAASSLFVLPVLYF